MKTRTNRISAAVGALALQPPACTTGCHDRHAVYRFFVKAA